ncbi:MAG: heme exporter protein CcmD [Rhodospirillales bacterium]|nr:heme exporter protein CcmD [Rhodospirillales bacterium]
MNDLNTYFNMGGYAAFVWPAYGISAIALVGLLWQSVAQLRRSETELRNLQGNDRLEEEN